MGCGGYNNNTSTGNSSRPNCADNQLPVLCPIGIDTAQFRDECAAFGVKLEDLKTRFNQCPQYYSKDDYTQLLNYLQVTTEQFCYNDALTATLLPNIIQKIQLLESYIQTLQNTINNILNTINSNNFGNGGCSGDTYIPGATITNPCLGIENNQSIAGLTRCQVLDMLIFNANAKCAGGEKYYPPTLKGVNPYVIGNAILNENVTFCVTWIGDHWENVIKSQGTGANMRYWKVEIIKPDGTIAESNTTDNGNICIKDVILDQEGDWDARVYGIGVRGEILSMTGTESANSGGGGGTVDVYSIPEITSLVTTTTPTTVNVGQAINIIATATVQAIHNILRAYNGQLFKYEVVDPNGAVVSSGTTSSTQFSFSAISISILGKYCVRIQAIGKRSEQLVRNSCEPMPNGNGGITVSYDPPNLYNVTVHTNNSNLVIGDSDAIQVGWQVYNPGNFRPDGMSGYKYKVQVLNPNGVTIDTIYSNNTQINTGSILFDKDGLYCVVVSAKSYTDETISSNSCNDGNSITVGYNVPSIDSITTTASGTLEIGSVTTIVANWVVSYYENIQLAQNGKRFKVRVVGPTGNTISTGYVDGNSYSFTAISLNVEGQYCVIVEATGRKYEQLQRSSCEQPPQGNGGINTTYQRPIITQVATNVTGTASLGQTIDVAILWDTSNEQNVAPNMNGKKYKVTFIKPDNTIYTTLYSDTRLVSISNILLDINGDYCAVVECMSIKSESSVGSSCDANGVGKIVVGGNRYYNTDQWADFTRNNCGPTSNGETIRYTVFRNTYLSYISQLDADQKALDDIAANGQQYANTHGQCSGKIYHLITYDNGAGQDPSVANMPNPLQESVETGTSYTISLTQPTRRGYTFSNWAAIDSRTGNFASGAVINNISGDITFIANWMAVPYNYDINLDGGNFPGGTGDIGSGTIPGLTNFSTTVYSPTKKPIKPGYTFNGWEDSDVTSPVFTGSQSNYVFIMPDRNVVIKATWVLGNGGSGHIISYNTNTFPVESTDHTNPNTISGNPFTIPYGNNHQIVDMANVNNFIFGGWENSGNIYNPGQVIVPSMDMDFNAVWNVDTSKKYTITYNTILIV